MRTIERPEHWLAFASRARLLAVGLTDSGAKSILEVFAKECEDMAGIAKSLAEDAAEKA
jgi:hypothetical protein